MRRLMAVVESGGVDIEAAYELFSHQRDGAPKASMTP